MQYTFESGIAFASKLDAEDPLFKFRERFYLSPGSIYMDGNSLGLCSKDAEAYILEVIEAWKKEAINIWTANSGHYFLYQDHLGKLLAPMINAESQEVTVMANTTLNIHSGIATFYKPTRERYKILVDDLNFPTDIYAVCSQVKLKGLDPADAVKSVPSRDGRTIEEEDIIAAMTDDVALVFLPAVQYRSAQLLDMKRITAEAHKRGIIIGWDLCHSIGAVPHDFADIDPDFAVWCNYKYLSAGPGAIAGFYLNKKHFGKEPGLAGWHGNKKESQFQMEHKFDHALSAGGWQTGTQPLLSMAPLEGVLRIYLEAGIGAVRKKSLQQTAYLMYLIESRLVQYGFQIGNPREDQRRGGHISLEHDEAFRICQALRQRKVIPDFREPNVVRLAPVALYTSYEDVYNLVEILDQIMKNKEYEAFDDARGLVV
ncbi:hypothetical protein AAG570_014062 [Ranatra chinensis]|uniref:Kynureninase n=1 Tax=Ranatra chinensis TaxID=642074 RepID=A0ABD0XSA2_9HEMI